MSLTPKQARIAAALIVSNIIDGITDQEAIEEFEPFLKMRMEHQLPYEEQDMIENEMIEISEKLLGEHLRFSSIQEIIQYARKC